MKKNLALVLVIAMAVSFSLSGCGGGESSTAKETTVAGGAASANGASDTGDSEAADIAAKPVSEEQRELVFYSTMMAESDFATWIQPFEEEHNVKLVYTKVTAEEFMKTITVAYNGGQQIDVLGINGQDIRTLSSRGVISPLDKVDYWDRFTDVSKEQASVDGVPYALPNDTVGGMTMYYNADLFEQYDVKLPTNMEELRAAKEAFAPHGISMFAHCGGTVYMWPSWFFMLFNSTSEGKAIERTEAILRGEAKFTDDDSLQAMKILEELGDGFFQPGVNGADREGGEQVFIQGSAAMTFAGSWQLGTFRLAGMEGDTLQSYSGMQFVDGQPFRTTGAAGAGNCLAICSKTNDEELAYQFIEYCSRDEKVQERVYADYLEAPAVSALIFANVNLTIPDGIEEDPNITIYAEELVPYMQLWLDWLWPAEVVTTAQEQIQMVVGLQTTAEDAVQAIQDTMDDLLASGYNFDSAE